MQEKSFLSYEGHLELLVAYLHYFQNMDHDETSYIYTQYP